MARMIKPCAFVGPQLTFLYEASAALLQNMTYGKVLWPVFFGGKNFKRARPNVCLQGKQWLILHATTYAKTELFYILKMPQAMRVPSCEPLHYQIMHYLGLQKLQLRLNRPEFELAIVVSFAWSFQQPSRISHMKDTSHPVSNGAERDSLQW